MRIVLFFLAFWVLLIGCSGVATKEEVTVMYKHHNVSQLEFNKAKTQFSEEEQLAIATRYKNMEELFRKILELNKNE